MFCLEAVRVIMRDNCRETVMTKDMSGITRRLRDAELSAAAKDACTLMDPNHADLTDTVWPCDASRL